MTGSGIPSEPTPEIEFWFEFGSSYSYLSVMRIEELAHQRWQGEKIAEGPPQTDIPAGDGQVAGVGCPGLSG